MVEKEITLEIKGKEYKVNISRFTAESAEIKVNDVSYSVVLKDLGVEQVANVKPQQAPRGPEAAVLQSTGARPDKPIRLHRPKTISDGATITAPLPGLITKIFINEGDIIKMGQRILMLEAMKMENEVNATSEGMVIDIRHKEGSSVNQGDVLIMLKPVEG